MVLFSICKIEHKIWGDVYLHKIFSLTTCKFQLLSLTYLGLDNYSYTSKPSAQNLSITKTASKQLFFKISLSLKLLGAQTNSNQIQ